MKDLKHMIYFEDLLQEANNALVRKCSDDGGIALGYTCYYIPMPLLNIGPCFSVRLRAPQSGTPEIANYYLTNHNCPFSRSLLERAIEGGYKFLAALIGSETCAAMDRAQEHFSLLDLGARPEFFVSHLDAPLKVDEASLRHYRGELQCKILDQLQARYGIVINEEDIYGAIKKHNRLASVITALGDFRKLTNPPITSYEFHVCCLVAQVCPQSLILPFLEETLEEVKTRKTDSKPPFRARVVVVGSEIDDPAFTKLLESCGLYAVADRYCYGSLPGFEPIELKDGEDALGALARHYLETSQCPRFMSREKADGRKRYIKELAERYHAEGVVFESMKFCEFWSYEKTLGSYILQNEMSIPCCTIERDYLTGAAGQLRTRFQAFAESLEFKKLAERGDSN